MAVTLGLLLSQHNARARRAPDPRVGLVLLERTLLDPPRAAAAKRWAAQIRRAFPSAELVPYAWHLLTHGPDERMAERSSRTLPGAPHLFGALRDNPQTRQAWDVTRLCLEAMGSTTVALRTPPSITPGALGRARIRAFVESRRAESLQVLWEPEGLWDPLVAAAFAAELDTPLMLPAFAGGRPLRQEATDALAAPGAWLRVDGSGPRQTIHGNIIDDLLDHTESAPGDTVIIFTGPRAHPNLALLADALGCS